MAVRLKNIGPDVDLYRPAGDPQSLFVEHGQIVEIPGELVKSKDAPEDAHLIDNDGDVRAWSTTTWELTTKSARQSADADTSKEG